ncbi:uncharacterized protein [Haliotis cracherodii]|uniref:uncharacterized protein n=1 Tax=Haliotis cracherodii TaxID=6455 RepID=UPI0039EA05E1
MMPRIWLCVCLGIAGQCIAGGDDDKIVKKPYGVAMCRQLCHQMIDCNVYLFSRSILSCCIPLSSNTECSDGTYFFPEDKQVEASINLTSRVSCQQNKQRVIFSRTKACQCVEWGVQVHDKEQHLGLPRLLLTLSSINNIRQFHQLPLNSGSEYEYPFIKDPKRVRAIAYIPSLKRIVVDMELSPLLVSFALDSYDKVVLKRGLHTNTICVDDGEKLVFVHVLRSPFRGIWRVSADGRDVKNIQNFRGESVTTFSIDCRNSRFYIFKFSGIYSSQYDGSDMTPFLMNVFSRIALIDHVNQELYYYRIKDGVVLKISVSDKTATSMISVPYTVSALAQYGSDMYISFFNTEKIGVLNLDSRKYREFQRMPYNMTGYAVILCILF